MPVFFWRRKKRQSSSPSSTSVAFPSHARRRPQSEHDDEAHDYDVNSVQRALSEGQFEIFDTMDEQGRFDTSREAPRASFSSRRQHPPPLDRRLGAAIVSQMDSDIKAAIEASLQDALSQLPETEWDEEPFECCFCLEMVEKGNCVRRLGCAHAFHKACIDQWLCHEQRGKERRCPLCNCDPLTGMAAGQTSKRQSGAGTAARSRSGTEGHQPGSPQTPVTQMRSRESSRAVVDAATGSILWGGVPVDTLLPRRFFQDDDELATAESPGESSPALSSPPMPSNRSSNHTARQTQSGSFTRAARGGALGVLMGHGTREGVHHA